MLVGVDDTSVKTGCGQGLVDGLLAALEYLAAYS